MSGAFAPSSSGAAKGGEEALVDGEDARNCVRLRTRIPLIDFEGAAEEDAVGAREHVAIPEIGVPNLRLRLENRELAPHRVKVGVTEQVATAKPGAVEHQAFRQRSNISGRSEPANLDLSAGNLHVANHLAEVAASLHVHRVVA